MAEDPGKDGGGRRLTYRDAGVDLERYDEALERIKRLVGSTKTPGVLSDLGSFGGLFAPDLGACASPILVSSCDGVGTKLRVAFLSGIHDTVGRDLVNHCVNDILVQGARPLFFMDYLATGRLEAEVLAAVVEGIARGCRESGCALLGGETAEMPGFYADGEYDIAGFVVGLVDREKLLDGSRIRAGDHVIGLASAGLHTNGYSLARKILFEVAELKLDDRVDGSNATVVESLLAEHRCYLRDLAEPLDEGRIHGLAHVTGGGVSGNLPRILPEGTAARLERGAWPVPPLFTALQRLGNVDPEEMERTFNMGIGMLAVVGPDEVEPFRAQLEQSGTEHYAIGEIVSGDGGVRYV